MRTPTSQQRGLHTEGPYCLRIRVQTFRGIARIFQGRGVTLCQSEGTHQIFMLVLPPYVGCLHEKASKRGEGDKGHPRTPLATSLALQ